VSQRRLVRDDYGFALQAGSALREPLDAAVLSILREPDWQEMRRRHLGAADGDS
jgi:hypothetical protein